MRTVDDAVKLHDAIAKRDYKDAVIVGASMVGIKVAELLHKRGCHVTLADMAPHIFALAAYPEVSEMIEARLEKMGIDMVFGKAIAGRGGAHRRGRQHHRHHGPAGRRAAPLRPSFWC